MTDMTDMTEQQTAQSVTEANVLVDNWPLLPEVVDLVAEDQEPRLEADGFSPGFALPVLDDRLREYLAPARARWLDLGQYAGRELRLLDLATNPATHTTKTFASLVIVARAIEFSRRTGHGVYIVSPTSANKGTALRDAVLRAYDAGLATPETLRVAVIAPHSCVGKLRASRLTDDPELRRLNPLLVNTGKADEDVKAIAREFAEQHAHDVRDRTGMFPWFSLDLRNYLIADTARAFFENDVSPSHAGRVHAHAVSSAFGLLGYHEGRRLLETTGRADAGDRAASLLVQHLATPDMVLHLLHGSHDRTGLPPYAERDGLWHQDTSPNFPAVADALDEAIEPTFYTHRPTTSPAMDAIIGQHGGSGVVVSRRECLERYDVVSDLVAATGRGLPADPAELREWSLLMALTGTFNALDRGLLPEASEVVVHGSGWYAASEFDAPAPDVLTAVDPADPIGSVLKAVAG
ncbi:DUF6002 family protein [Nocardioides speluncae]|uniref:DUF6002 family protein n=1 Tax=Nocardioides speluncae TaxID=2670337 RepID=UPI000D69B2CE|nr:DUF6002 family protein [Nocardioides speluncae]